MSTQSDTKHDNVCRENGFTEKKMAYINTHIHTSPHTEIFQQNKTLRSCLLGK